MRFQDKVLALTSKIPKGKVSTYGIIAGKLGTRAYRAVGTALRRNELPIKIPCHRVINSDGRVGNYSGEGGTKRKVELLTKERVKIVNGMVDYNFFYFFK